MGRGRFTFLLLMIWTAVCMNFDERKRNVVNAFLSFAAALIILYATVLTRAPGDYDIIHTICRIHRRASAARALPRDADECVPLLPAGADASNALPSKWRCRQPDRVHDIGRICSQRIY